MKPLPVLAMALMVAVGCGDDTPSVKVTVEGKTTQVSLGGHGWVTLGSDRVGAPIPELFAKATTEDLSGYRLDLVGASGSRPGTQAVCGAVAPIDGTLLSRGALDVSNRDLLWNDPQPLCLFMSDVAELVFTKK